MKRAAIALVRCTVALVGMGFAATGNAIDILGLPALSPVSVSDVTASVRQLALEIRYPGGCLRIHPWPDFLPRKLHAQSLKAERQPWPSGPLERVEFTRKGENRPWLIIVSHGRSSTPVVGAWRIERIDGRWYAADGSQHVLLPAPLPKKSAGNAYASIMSDGKRWQIHALSVEEETAGSPSASEREPRLAWAAVQR